MRSRWCPRSGDACRPGSSCWPRSASSSPRSITPVLPVDAPLSDRYRTTFLVLATVAVLGFGWEFVYHFLMQFRWEKDWPSHVRPAHGRSRGPAGLGAASPGCRARAARRRTPLAFAIHFVTVWLCVWLVANGPMRVPFIRWRFRGGRLA